MIELLILWIYMLIISTAIGILVLSGCDKLLNINRVTNYSFIGIQLAAVCFISVYAQIWSLFGRISALAHIFLLGVIVLIFLLGFVSSRFSNFKIPYTKFVDSIKSILRCLLSWEGALFIILILITAFYASRGNQHTDTYIYHAEMIRWYEEYGLVTGMGNLQNHFAYNSAYLAYASFWSMRWLLGQSLHGTNGFLQALLVVWSIKGLLAYKSHGNHVTDGCRLAIIIYAIVNSEYIMSPATDFGALYIVLWIIALWLQTSFEQNTGNESSIISTHIYGLLAVSSCIALTYKLSAGLIIIIAIYPAIILFKAKDYRKIILYITLGIVAVLPWIVRNIIISGCIVYPMTMFKLDMLDWAIPTKVLLEDDALISTWGKCLYDIDRANDSMRIWLPIWWDAKDTYEKMLIVSNVCAGLLEFVWIIDKIIHHKQINLAYGTLKLSIIPCMLIWFVKAPFIRYGLAFLLVIPLCEIAQWLTRNNTLHITGPISIISGFGVVAIALTLLMYINYYTLVDVNLAKANLKEPYYITQKDYAQVEYQTYNMNGMTIYYPAYSSDNSYAPIPSTAYIGMATRTKLRGTTIEDGFMPNE